LPVAPSFVDIDSPLPHASESRRDALSLLAVHIDSLHDPLIVCGACYIIPDFSTTLRGILSVAVQRDIDRRDIADLLDIPPAPLVEN
jgi:hypothetical protein